MKGEDFEEMLTLIRQEIDDAKIRAFDKMLQHVVSNKPGDEAYDAMGDILMEVYDEYKDDILKATSPPYITIFYLLRSNSHWLFDNSTFGEVIHSYL